MPTTISVTSNIHSNQTLHEMPSVKVYDKSYRDYANESVETLKKLLQPPKNKRKGPRGGVVVPFPVKLYDMLAGTLKEGREDIVSWQPHGRAFCVHKPKEFTEDIMPRYFRQSKMTSFQRQLNLYGFMRLHSGPDQGAYWHELFLRGRPDICNIMLRTRVKESTVKNTMATDAEPNFYKIPYCGASTTEVLENSPSPDLTSRSSSDLDSMNTPAKREIPSYIPHLTPIEQMLVNRRSESDLGTARQAIRHLRFQDPDPSRSLAASFELTDSIDSLGFRDMAEDPFLLQSYELMQEPLNNLPLYTANEMMKHGSEPLQCPPRPQRDTSLGSRQISKNSLYRSRSGVYVNGLPMPINMDAV